MLTHLPTNCPVCAGQRTEAFRHPILNKYPCAYFTCGQCGLLQTQEPFWLAEAYSSAIGRSDTGLLARNERAANMLTLLLPLISTRGGKFLDVAGGYGVLTRMMRDRGFDYFWSDKYCENIFASGFEDRPSNRYDVITAFEVLEHVTDPVGFFEGLFARHDCRTIVFSTVLFDGAPPPEHWWYYAFDGGQHVSFYQRRTIDAIARHLGLKSYTSGSVHILSERALPSLPLKLATNGVLASLVSPFSRALRRSKTMSDHIELNGQKR